MERSVYGRYSRDMIAVVNGDCIAVRPNSSLSQ